jgi:integrase
MFSVKLYLKEPKSNDKTLIYLSVNINGKRFKISTGEFVPPKYWNRKKEEITTGYKASMEINHLIQSMRSEVESVIRSKLTVKRTIDAREIRNEFNKSFQKKKAGNNFFDYYNEFIEDQKAHVKVGTLSSYKSTLNHLKYFNDKYHYNITFEKINHNFYNKFLQYLFEDIEVLNNSTGLYIKTLKTFMNYSTKRGINDNLIFKEFKVFKEDVENIYLTEEELEKLLKLDLIDRPDLKTIRDQFLLQCYTGMRFSDLMNIKPENIKSDYILIKTLKTREEVKISITRPIAEMLKNIPEHQIIKTTNHNMNDCLKDLGKKAGIDEPTQVIKYRGSQRIEKTVPKYELITTHTARRTFISVADMKGVRREIIKRVTGIRDDKTLQKYIKVTDKDITEEMQKIWG